MFFRLEAMLRKRLSVRIAHTQQFPLHPFRKRRASEPLTPRICEPQPFRMPEFSSKEKSRGGTAHGIGRGLNGKLWMRIHPFLILELLPIDTNRIVKLG